MDVKKLALNKPACEASFRLMELILERKEGETDMVEERAEEKAKDAQEVHLQWEKKLAAIPKELIYM